MILSLHNDKMVDIITEQVNIFRSIKYLLVECTYYKPTTKELPDRVFKTKYVGSKRFMNDKEAVGVCCVLMDL